MRAVHRIPRERVGRAAPAPSGTAAARPRIVQPASVPLPARPTREARVATVRTVRPAPATHIATRLAASFARGTRTVAARAVPTRRCASTTPIASPSAALSVPAMAPACAPPERWPPCVPKTTTAARRSALSSQATAMAAAPTASSEAPVSQRTTAWRAPVRSPRVWVAASAPIAQWAHSACRRNIASRVFAIPQETALESARPAPLDSRVTGRRTALRPCVSQAAAASCRATPSRSVPWRAEKLVARATSFSRLRRACWRSVVLGSPRDSSLAQVWGSAGPCGAGAAAAAWWGRHVA